MKTKLKSARNFGKGFIALTMFSVTAAAQTPAPVATTVVQTPAAAPASTVSPQTEQDRIRPRSPRRASTPSSRVTVIADEAVAPQVVTIVHRLSAMKMLRFMLRQGGEHPTVYTIDPTAMNSDAHASIIAGWALDDGRTIAARLPQATAEIEFSMFPFPPEAEKVGTPAAARRPMMFPRSQPDLTVITRDGKRLAAKLVGLDGLTGLSVLQITGNVLPPGASPAISKIVEGQRVQLFAPERTVPAGDEVPGVIYVRVGETDGTLSKLAAGNFEKQDRFTVRAAKLSPVLIGGIACDEAGNTLGIVEAVDGNDARIVSAETIRAAARRVIERQSSVPRPLLGVRGEPLDPQSRAALLANGWREDQLAELFEKQIGILLTSIMPGSPAELAKLRAGDVIVRVNRDEVKSAEEFSTLLGEIGSGEQVQFMIKRPGATTPVPVEVQLGASFEQFEYRMSPFAFPSGLQGLEGLGIETVKLTPKVASQFGAQGGLLVVAIQPDSAAAKAGVREGDVIETIDGRAIRTTARAFALARQKKHVMFLVRDREKKQVVVTTAVD